jgi:hypothetical protein
VLFLVLGAIMGAAFTGAGGGWWLYTRAGTVADANDAGGGSHEPKLRRPTPEFPEDRRFQVVSWRFRSRNEEQVIGKNDASLPVNFDSMSLANVLDFLSDFAGYRISLELAPADRDRIGRTKLSLHIPEIRLGNLVNILGDAFDLEPAIVDEGIRLVPRGQAANYMALDTYPLSDLIERPWTDARQRDWRELIQATIDPSSWTDQGDRGTIGTMGSNETLTVFQTDSNHAAITALLHELRTRSIWWPNELRSWNAFSRLQIEVPSFVWPEGTVEQAVAAIEQRLGVPIDISAEVAAGVDQAALDDARKSIETHAASNATIEGWNLLIALAYPVKLRLELVNGRVRLEPQADKGRGVGYPPWRERVSPQAQQITEKMYEPVTLEFVETPLGDVLEFLTDYLGKDCPIVMDPRVLIERSELLLTPISVHVEQIPLRSALARVFSRFDLIADVRHDVLFITSKAQRDRRFTTRVYPIGHLLPPSRFNDSEPDFDAAHWEQLIETSVAPKNWKSQGGDGSIRVLPERYALVIRQNESAHESIEQLLLQLRRATHQWTQPK